MTANLFENKSMRINPTMITWAREEAAYSIKEASEKIKKIEEWESGKDYPTYIQLEKMANLFKRPIAVFFFPKPPNLPPIRSSFRTLPDIEFGQIPPRMRYLIRKASAFQLSLHELCQGHNPSEHLILGNFQSIYNIGIAKLAQRARKYLGVSIEEQKSWNSAKDACDNWRSALAKVGIFVFKDAFLEQDYFGFCLYDDKFPIMYINNSVSKTRQCFSMFHELAHLIFNTSGIDKVNKNYIETLTVDEKKIEVDCNLFAAELLFPSNEYNKAMYNQRATEETAEKLADHYHVSREVIYRRFLDNKLIDQSTYTKATMNWSDQQDNNQQGGFVDPIRKTISYLGKDYIELALDKYFQNLIDQEQLAEHLNIKVGMVDELEEQFL